MKLVSVGIIYLIIIVLLGTSMWIQWTADSTYIRAPLQATVNIQEGFMNLNQWLPTADSVSGVQDCGAGGAAPVDPDKFKSFDLLGGGLKEPRVAKGPTAEQCYKMDYKRSLERAGSYGQRTNNYVHKYPDSCSAWNHDLILNFYPSKPVAGAIQV